MATDRILTMAQLERAEREAHLFATRKDRERRRRGRLDARERRWKRVADWAKEHARGARPAAFQVLHHGWNALELDLGAGRRVHVRQAGAGFYVAILGPRARGRMSVEQVLEVLGVLAGE